MSGQKPYPLPPLTWMGGTPQQRQAVLAALRASRFPWNLLTAPTRVNIGSNLPASDAAPGVVNMDAKLLSGSPFGYGVVQHEFGHEVDYELLSQAARQRLQGLLGGSAWLGSPQHEQNAGERFASMISSAYWPNRANPMIPSPAEGYPSAAAFRALLAQVLPGAPR